MKVTCSFCKEEIELNTDSLETRERQIDPHQQLRVHLLKHPFELAKHARAVGWLIDALAFRPSAGDDVEQWRDNLHTLADYFGGVMQPRELANRMPK